MPRRVAVLCSAIIATLVFLGAFLSSEITPDSEAERQSAAPEPSVFLDVLDPSEAERQSAAPEPSVFLDVLDPACGACFRRADLAVHRSVLAVGVSQPVAALHDFEYAVNYLCTEDASAKSLFEVGFAAFVWPQARLGALPFADMGLDVVLLDVSAVGPGHLNAVLAETVRVLSPAGTLVLTSEVGGALGPGTWAGALLRSTAFANVFVRAEGMVEGVPVCAKCGMEDPFTFANDRLTPALDGCQPYIRSDFVPLSKVSRQQQILGEASIGVGRLRHFPVLNVMHTQQAETCGLLDIARQEAVTGHRVRNAAVPCAFTDNYVFPEKKPWFHRNYVNPKPKKREWSRHLNSLVADGKVKSLLDAGGGSCTLEGELRISGLLKRLRPYMSFGAYDCSMLRICGERGAISFQYNWLNSLPFCRGCKFDMVFQAEGIHHIQGKENITKSLDHFDEFLACNGTLWVSDARQHKVLWHPTAKSWAEAKGYKILRVGKVEENMFGIEARKLC